MNVLKTGLLLVILSVLLVFAGGLIGGEQGAITAFVLTLIINLGAYWFSDKIVLARYKAKILSESEAPQVCRAVREIASRAGIPMPKIYWIPEITPNAFATGRSPKHAAVAVTSGLVKLMNEEELKGVIAHELGHVKNRDTLIMTVAASIAGAVMMLARMAQWAMWFGGGSRERDDRSSGAIQMVALLVVAILAPIAALLIQLAISRTREYSADKAGAHLAGTPYGLADALEKLESAAKAYPLQNADPATAHLFIVSPLSGGGISSLFSTHPPTKERVRRLRTMRL